MRAMGSMTVLSGDASRMFFDGLERERRINGVHMWIVSDNAADVLARISVRFFTGVPTASTAAQFLQGEPAFLRNPATGLEDINLPIGRYVFIPLDAIADRFSTIGMQVENPGAGNYFTSIGVEIGDIVGLPGTEGARAF